MSDTTAFDTWAIVEIMGHKQLAGRVSEQVIAGQEFLRIDVPAVAEEIATAAARRLRERPIEVFQMPTKQLTMGMDYEEDDPGF